jgi:predicted DNA-binding transcriptional regulator AlpA
MSTSASGAQAGFFRQVDLVGQFEVTPEQAVANRVMGRGIVRPRPGLRGLLPFSAPTLWRKIAAGEFPSPTKIGAIAAWPKASVHGWIAAQLEPQPAGDADGAKQAAAKSVRPRSRGRFVAAVHVGTQVEASSSRTLASVDEVESFAARVSGVRP